MGIIHHYSDSASEIESIGWYATKIDNDIYNVTYEIKQKDKSTIYEFKTNIKTGKVIGTNDLGKWIIDIVKYYNSDSIDK